MQKANPKKTIKQALYQATKLLKGISRSASLDAEVLMCHVLKIDKNKLFQNLDKNITASQLKAFHVLLRRRKMQEPIAYIVNHKEFFGLDFYIDKRVLVPRPETETLVEETLKLLPKYFQLKKPEEIYRLRINIVDVGTGSGCIAVTLAKILPQTKIFATDISKNALQIAKINIKKHGLSNQIKLLYGNLLHPLKNKVDVIIANLPYLTLGQLQATEVEIKKYEPKIALLAGSTEVKLYDKLLKMAPKYLRKKNWLIVLEIDPVFKSKILGCIKKYFPGSKTIVKKDLAGLDRIIFIFS